MKKRKAVRFKFIYECKMIALKKMKIPTGLINVGDVFYLKDALIDTVNGRKGIFLGIKTNKGIMEAGFSHPNIDKINSKKAMKDAIVGTLIIPYIEGATHDILFVNNI